MILEKITLKEYAKLDDTEWIDAIIKNGLARNKILRVGKKQLKPRVATIWKVTLAEMINLEKWVEAKMFHLVVQNIWDVSEDELMGCNLFNVFSCYNWVTGELEEIEKIEKANLTPTKKMSKEKPKDLSKFGYLPLIRKIQSRTYESEKEIYLWTYDKIFMEMCLIKAEEE